jgi:hypothetical protein
MMHAYVTFCDGNGLKRIDATAEEHLQNLDKMAIEILKLRGGYIVEIANRCPSCSGSGKRA